MVNNHSGNFNEQEQWYPRLPDGYEDSTAQRMPGYGSGGGFPGQGAPGFPPGGSFPGQGAPGFPPGGSFPGQGPPGFPPGGGFPGQGPPGFPPGGGFPGQGPPGFPPGGGFPGQGPPGFPPGGGFPGQQQAPTSAPPNITPEYPGNQSGAQLFAVDPGAIRGCLFRFTFVWLSRRQGFWFFPTFVGRNSVAGFRWRSRQRRWEYFGIDLDRIDQFTCY